MRRAAVLRQCAGAAALALEVAARPMPRRQIRPLTGATPSLLTKNRPPHQEPARRQLQTEVGNGLHAKNNRVIAQPFSRLIPVFRPRQDGSRRLRCFSTTLCPISMTLSFKGVMLY